MSLFVRVPHLACKAQTYSPIVQLLDDYSNHTKYASDVKQLSTSATEQSSKFSPTVDVRELPDAFELHLELAGVDKHDVNVELTGDDILRISGHKERRYITPIHEESEEAVLESPSPTDSREWQRLSDSVESIDAATAGPKSGERRTSLVDVSNWRASGENIDASTSVHVEEKRKRRPSVTNAQEWEQPLQVIDASAHHDHTQKPTTRRQSITNARNWQKPTLNIDASFTAPERVVAADAVTSENRKASIDGATTYTPRNPAGIYTPRPRPAKKHQYQPWLLSERQFGTFSREFKFACPVERVGITATFKDGVLTVVVPKRSREGLQKIHISVL